jgi:hypothetical protein
MIRYKFNKYDLNDLEAQLDSLEKKTKRSIIRKATRHSQRRHILPQVKRVTPSGGKGARGLHINKAGERNNRAFQAYAWTGGRSKGKLRRSWKIQAMKRSQKISGTSVASFAKETFYGKFLELGRTHNLFLPKREWDNVPAYRKGKRGDLWKPGRHMWGRVARRRGKIAMRAAIREMWRLMTKEMSGRK